MTTPTRVFGAMAAMYTTKVAAAAAAINTYLDVAHFDG
jgi:hypothetical protein